MRMRLLLIALYPLLLAARAAMWLRGRDPLRLKEPAGSCWIARPEAPPARSYFSERATGERQSTTAAIAGRIAGAFAPGSDPAGKDASNALPADIPDEVYTLW